VDLKLEQLRRVIRGIIKEVSDNFPPGRWTAAEGEPASDDDLTALGDGGFGQDDADPDQ
jgi:hypothetical protein